MSGNGLCSGPDLDNLFNKELFSEDPMMSPENNIHVTDQLDTSEEDCTQVDNIDNDEQDCDSDCPPEEEEEDCDEECSVEEEEENKEEEDCDEECPVEEEDEEKEDCDEECPIEEEEDCDADCPIEEEDDNNNNSNDPPPNVTDCIGYCEELCTKGSACSEECDALCTGTDTCNGNEICICTPGGTCPTSPTEIEKIKTCIDNNDNPSDIRDCINKDDEDTAEPDYDYDDKEPELRMATNVKTQTCEINDHYDFPPGFQDCADENDNVPNGNQAVGHGYKPAPIGDFSLATGLCTVASGIGSAAFGCNTKALGDCSHVQGGPDQQTALGTDYHFPAPVAVGTESHAEGIATAAQGKASHVQGSGRLMVFQNQQNVQDTVLFFPGPTTGANATAAHAEGQSTKADGIASHAEGGPSYYLKEMRNPNDSTKTILVPTPISGPHAVGECSHAEGCGTVAYGPMSHVEGFNNISGKHIYDNNKRSGSTSHVEGNNNTDVGLNTHIEGSGNKMHAKGMYYTDNQGQKQYVIYSVNSHLEGENNEANGAQCHVEGANNIAQGFQDHVDGCCNTTQDMFEGQNLHGIGGNYRASGSPGSTTNSSNYSIQLSGNYSGNSKYSGEGISVIQQTHHFGIYPMGVVSADRFRADGPNLSVLMQGYLDSQGQPIPTGTWVGLSTGNNPEFPLNDGMHPEFVSPAFGGNDVIGVIVEDTGVLLNAGYFPASSHEHALIPNKVEVNGAMYNRVIRNALGVPELYADIVGTAYKHLRMLQIKITPEIKQILENEQNSLEIYDKIIPHIPRSVQRKYFRKLRDNYGKNNKIMIMNKEVKKIPAGNNNQELLLTKHVMESIDHTVLQSITISGPSEVQDQIRAIDYAPAEILSTMNSKTYKIAITGIIAAKHDGSCIAGQYCIIINGVATIAPGPPVSEVAAFRVVKVLNAEYILVLLTGR